MRALRGVASLARNVVLSRYNVVRKMTLQRATSIAGENSINFELNFQILSDDRGPGLLSSDEIWEFNFMFIEFSPTIEVARRSCTSGVQICLTQSSLDSTK